ncbi:MAG TPA: molybdopterin-guanine dinucleotide biosynthesis protein B [Deltaproteobacteria bacterium]|nr:molybdopterin-guanine dinucleotide biosynthesis protein B [Deltaproteobacteria bacterium]
MERKKIPIVSIVGRAKTGKTTVVAKLIAILKDRGIRVATIKHHPHDFEIDREGKDTDRHKKAGAVLSMIASPRKIAVVRDVEEEMTVDQLVSRYIDDVDLIITEGFKREHFPKIEVYSARSEPPATLDDPQLLALMSDTPVDAPVPVLKRDDVEAAADIIVKAVFGKTKKG